MENEVKRVIEVGGIKMEVDLRHAVKVEAYKIGDNVKLLKKKYSDSYVSYPGVIVGFDAFEALPTIIIAYMEVEHSAELHFEFLNANSKNVEICPMIGQEHVIDKDRAIEMLDASIEKKQQELVDLKAQKNYFVENFKRYFAP